MMGISMVSSRRLPSSLSKRPMGAPRNLLCRHPRGARFPTCLFATGTLENVPHEHLVVTRHRLDGGDHFLVRHFIGRADEGGVALVHEDRQVALSVPPQRVHQLLTLLVVQGSKVHRVSSL